MPLLQWIGLACKPKFLKDLLFLTLHFLSVVETVQMEKAVDEKQGKSRSERRAEFPSFALGFRDVEKYFAALFVEREGEHVRRVLFMSVGLIHTTREAVAADNETQFVI